ncbi:MAG: hypothetical protein RMJ56_03280 [Gemmataceae bacterium]|nr:hypothetical protein [Gemmata sp.]MDW8196611.1 hypothetical protein [Gemmataceae bacterium]
MESILIHVYRDMLNDYCGACSVDRILADPDFRQEFLARVRRHGSEKSEFEILHGLILLRKRARLPRRSERHSSIVR